MINIILSVVILLILGLASWKIYSDKKQGVMCIGCPYSPKGVKKGATPPCHNDQVVQIKF